MNTLQALVLIGLTSVLDGFKFRVSNGSITEEASHPFANYLRITEKGGHNKGEYRCTGSLISSSVIITAGHCAGDHQEMLFVSSVFPRRGKSGIIIRQTFPIKTVYRAHVDTIRHFVKHRDGVLAPGENGYTDLAIVVLANPLPICTPTSSFQVIRLPINNISAASWAYEEGNVHKCTLLGYGSHENGLSDGKLRSLNVKLRDHGNVFYMPFIQNATFGRACSGDSGGPTVCEIGDKGRRLLGLTAFSFSPIWGVSRQCKGDQHAYLFDVVVDTRKILHRIQAFLKQLGMLDAFIRDYQRCSDKGFF